MSISIESLSEHDRTTFLARLAHTLTVCARDTYEVGTDQVLNPEVLRAYNELMHRVTGALIDRLLGQEGYSVEVILEMAREFGERNNRTGVIKWAVESVVRKMQPPPVH